MAWRLVDRHPEILGPLVVAGEEQRVADAGALGEGQREGEVPLLTVRRPSLPFETERREDRQAVSGEIGAVGGRIVALQRQHRYPLALLEVVDVEAGEDLLARFGGRLVVDHRQQFEKAAVELHQRIGGAERMARLRRQREAEPAIGGARRREVVDGDDEVIDRANRGAGWFRHPPI